MAASLRTWTADRCAVTNTLMIRLTLDYTTPLKSLKTLLRGPEVREEINYPDDELSGPAYNEPADEEDLDAAIDRMLEE